MTEGPSALPGPGSQARLGLVELVHRVLDRGAVIHGDVVISVAGVDLVYVGLRVVLASAESMRARELARPAGPELTGREEGEGHDG